MIDEAENIICLDSNTSEDVPTNPKKEAMRKIIGEAQNMALCKVVSAKSLADFLLYHHVALLCCLGKMEWLFDSPESAPQKPEDIIKEYESIFFKKLYAKESETVQDMKELIDGVKDASQMRVALARFRESAHAPYTYRVLAAFPRGTKIDDNVLKPKNRETADHIDFLYYVPQEACVQHACDLLFRQNRVSGTLKARAIFQMPYFSWGDAYRAVSKHTDGRRSEFVIDRRLNNTPITQEPQTYIFAGIQGVFSNEWNRTRVSDFWRSTQGPIS